LIKRACAFLSMTTFLTAQSLEDLELTKKKESVRRIPTSEHGASNSQTLALHRASVDTIGQGGAARRSSSSRLALEAGEKAGPIRQSFGELNTKPQKVENEKTLQRACFVPDDPMYYKKFQAKPAFDWFRGLTTRDPRVAQNALAMLEVPIPDMFCFFGIRRYWLKNVHPSGRGGIALLTDNDFDKIVMHDQVESWSRGAQQNLPGTWQGTTPPLAVQKTRSKMYANNSRVLDEANLHHALQRDPSADDFILFQRYICPRAGAKASIFRVAWRDTMGCFGVCLINNSTAEELRAAGQDLSAQWTVSMERPGSVHVFELRTVPSEAATIAERVAKFTQNFFRIRLKQLVVDVVQDRDGRFLFLQVKGFTAHDGGPGSPVAGEGSGANRKLNAAKSMSTLLDWRRGTVDFKEGVGNKVQESGLESFCRMCQCLHPVAKLKKKMTVKMMLETEHHLRKRGLELFHVKRPKQDKLTQQFNVCELCWSLYRAEAELQRTEMQVAHAVHIDVSACQEEAYVPFAGVLDSVQSGRKPIDFSGHLKRRDVLHVSNPEPPLPLTHSASMPALPPSGETEPQAETRICNRGGGEALAYTDPLREDCVINPVPEALTQWRMMVHFHSLTDVSERIQHLSTQTRLKLRLVVPWKRDEPLDLDLNPFGSSHVQLRRTTLHFLFTDPADNHPLQSVLSEGTLQFHLLAEHREVDPAELVTPGVLSRAASTGALNVKEQRQQDWFELFAGSCSLSQMLENKEDFRSQTLLMLFSRDFGSCHLKVTLGLKKDNRINTQYTMLCPVQEAWVPTRPFFTSDPLPVTWIDCIVDGSRDAFEAAANFGRFGADESKRRKSSGDQLTALAGKVAKEGRHAPGMTILANNHAGTPLTGPLFLAPRPTEVVSAGCGRGKVKQRPEGPKPRSHPLVSRSQSMCSLRSLREGRSTRTPMTVSDDEQFGGASSSAGGSTRPPSASSTYTTYTPVGSRPTSAALPSRPQSAGPSRPDTSQQQSDGQESSETLPPRAHSAITASSFSSVKGANALYGTPQATGFRGREPTYTQPRPGRPSSAQAHRERPSSASAALPARPTSAPQRRPDRDASSAGTEQPLQRGASRGERQESRGERGLTDNELARIEQHLERLKTELQMHQAEFSEL